MEVVVNKIAYLGYDFFYTCFEALVDNGYNIKWLFITERDNIYEFNDKLISKANSIGAEIISDKINDSHIEMLKEQGCDLIVSAAYPYKIPILPESPYVINIHPALLPLGRGPWPLPFVILKNHTRSGVTIHKITNEFDKGDIIIQGSFDVSANENLESLSCKTQMIAKKKLTLLMGNFEMYWNTAEKQGVGEYWEMPSDVERTLDWNFTTMELDRIVRAFGKFDSFAVFDNKEWIVQDATIWKESHSDAPGTVIHRRNKEVVIACFDGYVCLKYYKIDPDFNAK